MLQKEYYIAISSLKEVLTIAQKDNKAIAKDTKNLKGELSIIKTNNKILQRHKAKLDI